MKRTIKLRESELRRMIAESVKRVLMEQEVPDASVYVGYKTFNTNKFQEVQNFLNENGYSFETEKTYVHGPNAGTPEYQHNRLAGGIIRIEGKLPKDEAYSLAKELLNNFGKCVSINGYLCQNIREVELQIDRFSM